MLPQKQLIEPTCQYILFLIFIPSIFPEKLTSQQASPAPAVMHVQIHHQRKFPPPQNQDLHTRGQDRNYLPRTVTLGLDCDQILGQPCSDAEEVCSNR